ncbi:hypothetical protein FKM82_002189 [Ascaphus truei]
MLLFKDKTIMLSRQCLIGSVVVLTVFVLGFWIRYQEPIFPLLNQGNRIDLGILQEKKIKDGILALKSCERQLTLKRTDIGRKTALKDLTPWLAPIIWDGTYDLNILNNQFKGKRIGLFVFAVKKYIKFLRPFLESAERYFMVGHTVKYYVFTDHVDDFQKPELGADRTLMLLKVVADQRWQDVSMRRMEALIKLTREQLPNEIDYLVCADVDMVFNDHVGVEILGDLVATVHPGYFLTEPARFPYERRPISKANIPHGEGDFYYMAAFYGGSVEEIYKLSTACNKGIMTDKEKNIEAAWQEESHLNKYLVDNKPTKVLSPEYLWDSTLPNGDLVSRRRFLAVPKNHYQVRN